MKLPDKRLERVLEKFSERVRHRQTLSMRKLANSRKERYSSDASWAVSE